MYLAEDEARQQICPFIRFIVNEAIYLDSGTVIYRHQTCQASKCKTAWRARQDGKGYCGMAGKPTGWPEETEKWDATNVTNI